MPSDKPIIEATLEADATKQKFAWPPVEPDATKPAQIIESKPFKPGSPPLNKARTPNWIEQVETALLGTRARILTGRDSRWQPEPTGSACPRCGRSVGEGEVSPDDGRCIGCRPEKLDWDRLIRLDRFEGPLREAIHATKYEAWRAQGTKLGRLLGFRVLDELSRTNTDLESAIAVPVPMPTLRRMSRGIDHSTVLARGVSATSGVRMVPMLTRSGGKPQVSVPASLRAGNLHEKIRISRRVQNRPSVVVLVDDVKTTGATLKACSRAIRSILAGTELEIWSAVVAVTPDRNHR